MSERKSGLVVILEADADEDTADDIAYAIRQLRGVADVRTLNAEPVSHLIAATRRDNVWAVELRQLLHRMVGG